MRSAGTATSNAAGQPTFAARCAVASATLALPRGPHRDRYRQELLAELYFIDSSAQLRFSVGILSRAWALRRALTKEGTMITDALPRTPLLCRLNIRHQYRITSTEDGVRFRRCRRCGKDHPSTGGAHWASISGM